jgi:hypothetical protein
VNKSIYYLGLPAALLVLALLACELPGDTGQSATETMRALGTVVSRTLEPDGDSPGSDSADSTAEDKPEAAAPSDTPEPTATATLGPPMLSVSVDTNCRFGPGEVYDYLGAILVGEEELVTGKLADESFWQIENPDAPPPHCWVWGMYASISGDKSGIPILTPPPTPTPAPGSISGYTFIDGNYNGVRDASEVDDYVNGAIIHLKTGACPGGADIATTESASPHGEYRFDGLAPGDYCVERDFLQQTLYPDRHTVTVGPGEDVVNVNFRYEP